MLDGNQKLIRCQYSGTMDQIEIMLNGSQYNVLYLFPIAILKIQHEGDLGV